MILIILIISCCCYSGVRDFYCFDEGDSWSYLYTETDSTRDVQNSIKQSIITIKLNRIYMIGENHHYHFTTRDSSLSTIKIKKDSVHIIVNSKNAKYVGHMSQPSPYYLPFLPFCTFMDSTGKFFTRNDTSFYSRENDRVFDGTNYSNYREWSRTGLTKSFSKIYFTDNNITIVIKINISPVSVNHFFNVYTVKNYRIFNISFRKRNTAYGFYVLKNGFMYNMRGSLIQNSEVYLCN